jgi:type VI secretion system secreted protein VgrG
MADGKGNEPKFLFEVKGASHTISVVNFTLCERISFPFEFKGSLACEDEIKFEDVVGKEALLTIKSDEGDRYCHGVVKQFAQNGKKSKKNLYRALLVPSLWLLSREQDCRIFQNMTVQDIVTQIFQDGGIASDRFDFRLQNTYPPREYCVQYRETDLNFISRLLEEEGIFYFFEHSKDKHLLILGDSTVAYQTLPGKAEVPFNATGMEKEKEAVKDFTFSQKVFSGKMTRKDYNFEKPSLDLTAENQDESYEKLEVYDYPGNYLDEDRGKMLVGTRLEESKTFKEKAKGKSLCSRLTPGYKFKLTDHERSGFNQEYLLVEVRNTGAQPQVLEEQSKSGKGLTYSNTFVAIPSAVTLRPERKTPRPVIEGVQTAIVTGPSGEEIYTDQHGRVKIQFHWDRLGTRDENSSCWIRVGQLWAGPGWGALYIPRIGQEVIVHFLEGDPDRPIIIGCVYHGENPPPYGLPDQKTKSTIKSNSSIGGEGFNEIRFEDAKGSEQVFIYGQNDLDLRINHDRREWIGNDQNFIAIRNQLEKVEGTKHLIVLGDQNEKVDGTVSLKVGIDHQEKVALKYAVDAGMEIHLKAGMNVVLEAGMSITLKAGGGFIVVGPAGVTISGTPVLINSGGSPGVGSGSSPQEPLEPQEADAGSGTEAP